LSKMNQMQQWGSVICKQMPSQTLDSGTYEIRETFKNTCKK